MLNNSSGSNQTTSLVPEPYISKVIRLTLGTMVFLLTLSGNVLVIAVIMKNRKLRSLDTYYYGYYLLNLAVADLAVALLVIPFSVFYTETGSWPFGLFLCKVLPTLLVAALTASILTLLILTFERYWAIVYPLKPRLPRNKLIAILTLIWVISIAVASPELFVYQLKHNVSGSRIEDKYPCAEVWANKKQRQAYTMFLFVFCYILPLFLILAAYLRIICELKRSKTQCFGARDKIHMRKTVRVLIVVVASFALCYLPERIFFLWIDYGNGGSYPCIDIFMKYSYLTSWLNSCLNPIIYGAVDMNFRYFYRLVIRQCAGCKKYSSEMKRRLSSAKASTRQGEYALTSDIGREDVGQCPV